MAQFHRWYGSIFKMPPAMYRLAYKPSGTLTASIRCPLCSQLFTIVHHTLKQGTVIPSVVCPNPDCAFHESVELLGTPTGS